MIRTSLLYLLAGSVAGGLLLAGVGAGRTDLAEGHRQAMLQGWVAQFALGTAFWVLPRMRGSPSREAGPAGWLGYLSLNTGLAMALIQCAAGRPVSWPGPAVQAAGAILLAGGLWRRVKPFGS
jgi:hypothetical protein